ncbi:hypothetical protein ColLi_09170 [Colletotrichum liriopes]|uniref:Uncharacterized protein n=1 Tax=Colletotrichum liriopes TaxID=708192 RepID=A0AA37GSU4_9PEZI|nr:hypothetical protein ColLi_09170 [Colletotrichum liriopes]
MAGTSNAESDVEPWFQETRLILPNENIFLGPPERAASIAILQAADTPQNEALVRTYHPAFAYTHDIDVYIKREKTGRRIWVITCTTTCCDWTHAGGLEIHHIPDRQFFYELPT